MTKRSNNGVKHRAVRTALLVFVSLVVGFSVYSWNAKRLVGNMLPMPFGFGVSVILSGSMEPALSENDLVFIKSCDSYECNDVVVYQSDGVLVIHRILKIDGDTVVTQGDANTVPDHPITLSDIKGKLVGRVQYIGYAVKMLKTPIGVIVMLAAAVLLLELSWRREKKNSLDEIELIKEEIRKLKGE